MAWFFYFLCCDALSTRNCRVLELVHHHRDVLVFTLESFGLFLSFWRNVSPLPSREQQRLGYFFQLGQLTCKSFKSAISFLICSLLSLELLQEVDEDARAAVTAANRLSKAWIFCWSVFSFDFSFAVNWAWTDWSSWWWAPITLDILSAYCSAAWLWDRVISDNRRWADCWASLRLDSWLSFNPLIADVWPCQMKYQEKKRTDC